MTGANIDAGSRQNTGMQDIGMFSRAHRHVYFGFTVLRVIW